MLGRLAKIYRYDAYGNLYYESQPPALVDEYAYTARRLHDRSGLYYYRTRFYSPEVGRFITQDPIGHMGGVNLYAYVGNDPVNWVDPLGLWTYPTTGPIRVEDKHGKGGYGAERTGGRIHAGVDYSGEKGSVVVAPMGGTLEMVKDGVRITGRVDGALYSTRVLHIEVTAKPGSIDEGNSIGTIVDLSVKYPGITNHAHVELYEIRNGKTIRLNPADYIPEYKEPESKICPPKSGSE